MKAICVVCRREYEVNADAPLGQCVSCGGQLKPLPISGETVNVAPAPADPAKITPPSEGTLELAGESPEAGVNCPNCGKWIEPGAQICTACGYSRRLARTLTTRVGTPEIPKPKSKRSAGESEIPEIEAEKTYRRAKERARIGRGDAFRLFISALAVLALAAIVMGAPMNWLGLVPLKLPALLQPPRFDALNASFLMLMFLIVAVPVTAVGVRIAAFMTNTEINTYFSWLRTAGALAATLVSLAIVFTVNETALRLPTLLLLPVLAATAGLVLLLFTWFLHDVNFSNAIVLTLATLISAAVGLFAAALAFGWIGNLIGIDPVIRPRDLFLR